MVTWILIKLLPWRAQGIIPNKISYNSLNSRNRICNSNNRSNTCLAKGVESHMDQLLKWANSVKACSDQLLEEVQGRATTQIRVT